MHSMNSVIDNFLFYIESAAVFISIVDIVVIVQKERKSKRKNAHKQIVKIWTHGWIELKCIGIDDWARKRLLQIDKNINGSWPELGTSSRACALVRANDISVKITHFHQRTINEQSNQHFFIKQFFLSRNSINEIVRACVYVWAFASDGKFQMKIC